MGIDVGFWLVGLGVLALGVRPFFLTQLSKMEVVQADDKASMQVLLVGGATCLAVGLLRLLFVYVLN